MDKSVNPYVYLVDNAQNMMLILKRDLDDINGNNSADEPHQFRNSLRARYIISWTGLTVMGPLSLREMEVLITPRWVNQTNRSRK